MTKAIQAKNIKLTLGKVCPRCHYVVPFKAIYCYNCGLDFKRHARCPAVDAGKHSLPTLKQTKKCPKCKHQISSVEHYCDHCGHKFPI